MDAAWLTVDRSDDLPVLMRTARYEGRLAANGRNRGECAVLALTAVRGWTAVVDDSEARKIAREDNIRHKTTAALLLQAISEELMTRESCAVIIDALLRTQYRLPFGSGQEFLDWVARGEAIE